jgi:hypothetical protein
MSGTESTHQTPNLGQIWSTCQGPKWPKSVPDLNRNFQGAFLRPGSKSDFNQEIHATLLDVRSPPPSLTVPVTLSSLCDLERDPRLGSVVSTAPEDTACRQFHGTSPHHCVLFHVPLFFAMTFCNFFDSKYVPFEHIGFTLYLWGRK